MLKFRDRELDAEQFALEYLRHHVLYKNKHKQDKYKCVVAYHALAKRLGLSASQARAFEQRFRDYVYNKMQTSVEAGLRDAAELPHELRWLRLVEDEFNLLPNLLQERGFDAGEAASPERVLRALCTQAVLRGAVQHPDMFAAVQCALGLSTDVQDLQDVWCSARRLALQFVSLSARAGDTLAPPPLLARVADVALLYTDVADFQLVDDESERCYAEAEALSVLWQLVQRLGLAEAGAGAGRWGRAAREYGARGRRASALLLRRRWHELAQRARRRLLAHWRAPRDLDLPTPLHVAIVERYPHIVTSPMPSWSELVARGDVVWAPLNEQDFAEATAHELVTSPVAVTVTSQVAPSGVTSRTPPTVTSQPAPVPVTSHAAATVMTQKSSAPSLHFNLGEDTKLIKPDPDGEATQVVKCERLIKTEVLDNEDDVAYDARNNAQNDPDNEYELEISIKKEPRETMSSRILFDDDDHTNGDDDGDGDQDDVISELDSDEDFRNSEFDNKLLDWPRVELTRPRVKGERRNETDDVRPAAGASRILFEDDDDVEIDTSGNDGTSGQEVQIPNKDFRQTKKRCRLSKAQKSLSEHSQRASLFYMKPVAHAPKNDESKHAGSTVEGLPTLPQLKQVLEALTNVSCANHVLKQTRQYCCLARKHQDISDARRRMGIAPTPHIHPDKAPCTCCCERAHLPRLPDLERGERALHARLATMLQATSFQKSENLPTTSKSLEDKRETSATCNTTFIPKPLSVANSTTKSRSVQSSSVTRTPNKAKEGASVPVCREPVTPLHSEPTTPLKVATIEHMPHDRGDGALTPPLPKARSDIPLQVKLKHDDTLVFPALVKTSIQFRVAISDTSLRPYNSIPLQVIFRCNKTIERDTRAVGDIVAHVAQVINKILVQVAIRRNRQQMPNALQQNQVLYVELECNIKAIHSAFMHKDIYVDMACDKISFSGTLDQSGSASCDDDRYYRTFVHGPLLQDELLVYKTERKEIKKQNIKQYSKSTTIILDSFCNETNRFEQFLTYPLYKARSKSTTKKYKRSQSKKEILQPAPSVSAPQKEVILLKKTESEYENPDVISLDSISETSIVLQGHDEEIFNVSESDPATNNISSTAASTAAARNDGKEKPSGLNTASKPVKLSDKDKLKLFSSKHECTYMRRTMELLMQSKKLPPVTLCENPIPTLFVGEYPKKTSQKIQPHKSVVHKPVRNELSQRDYSQIQKIKPRAYSGNRQNSSDDYPEIIHKNIEINDTDRIVDHAPGRRSLSVSFRNNIVTHNELMLVQKLKEKFKQPRKLQNKQPETCTPSNKSNPSLVEAKGVPQVQLHRAYSSIDNNVVAQTPEKEITTKTEPTLPVRCLSPREKSSQDSDMSIITETAIQPVPPNSGTDNTEIETSKHSAPLEQQSISPNDHSDQAPEPGPVSASVLANDEDSDTFKAAKLVQRRISDGIRKGFMFMVPSSLRGKNNIINVPETASHAKFLATEYLAQLDSCLDNDFEVLDPVRLIPLTLIPDELRLGAPKKMEPISTAKLTISGKQLQEVPVISETDLLDPVAKARRASDASRNMNPPPVLSKSLIRRRHSHHNFEPETKESSLKGKIKAEWFKNFVPTRSPRKRRQSVPNSSYPARSKLLSPINFAANVSDKSGNVSTNQSCKIIERKQCKVQIKWNGVNDTKPAPCLVRRKTITTEKPVLTKTNGQGSLATLIEQLAKVSPKIVSAKAEPTAKYLEKITSPMVMPQPLKITKRPTCLVRIRPWTGLSETDINISKKSDFTLTNAILHNEAITPPTLAGTNSNSDMDSTDTKNLNVLKRRNSLCPNEDHQDKKVKMDIPIPPLPPFTQTNPDGDMKQEINTCSFFKNDKIEIINIPDPFPPLPSPPLLPPTVTSGPRHSLIMSDQKEVLAPSKCVLLSDTLRQRDSSPLCVAIPQQDDLQLEVSENEQLCLALADSDRHLLMLKSIPKPTAINTFVQILEPESHYLDISPTSNECQNIIQLNTEQTYPAISYYISPDHNQKISGELQNECNKAALPAASLAHVEELTNDENINKELNQSSSSKVSSQVCIVEQQIMLNATADRLIQEGILLENKMPSPTEVELAKRDQPLMLSESLPKEYNDSVTEERPTIHGVRKTEFKQPMLAIIMTLDTTGLVEFIDLNDELACQNIKTVIQNQSNVSFKGIGDLCEPTELISITPWDSKNCGIAVQDIPLPSDDKKDGNTGNGAKVVTAGVEPEGTHSTKHVPLNENASSLYLLQDIINSKEPKASQQQLPTIFIFKEEAPIVAASSLSSDTIILCFDRCQIPLSMCYEYLVLTDFKIPCNGPMYFTLAPYDEVVQVAMDLISPVNMVSDHSNVEKQNSYDITVKDNNICISIKNNERNHNVAKEDNNESGNGNNNGTHDNNDMIIGNNTLSNSSDNKNDNKANFNKAMVDEVNNKMDNSGVKPNIKSSTRGPPTNKILSVVCTLESFRRLLVSGARLWVLATTPGRCAVLERALMGRRLVLYGDLGSDFLAELAQQLNAAPAQPTRNDAQRN